MRLIIFIIFLISLSNSTYANSKKDSIFVGDKPMLDYMWQIGWNASWGAACNKIDGPKFQKSIANKIALLSWPDYKGYLHGVAKWGNRESLGCSEQEFEEIKADLLYHVYELETAVKMRIDKSTVQIKMELNQLYEDGLISKKVYKKKLKELR